MRSKFEFTKIVTICDFEIAISVNENVKCDLYNTKEINTKGLFASCI